MQGGKHKVQRSPPIRYSKGKRLLSIVKEVYYKKGRIRQKYRQKELTITLLEPKIY